MTIRVDDELLPDDRMPPRDDGAFAPFETMGAHNGAVPLWTEHLQRLTAAAGRLGLSFSPGPELRAGATELLLANGDGDGILRLMLVPSGGRVRTVLTSRSRGVALSTVKLLPTVVERPAGVPFDLKVAPRRFWDAVQQQAQDGGADDGIAVDADGTVREAATGNLWLRIDSVWITPALDGMVLPGIARARLLTEARAAGLTVVERRCELDDLHRAEALAHSNAVHGPRAAVLLGQAAETVRFVDTELAPLWRPSISE